MSRWRRRLSALAVALALVGAGAATAAGSPAGQPPAGPVGEASVDDLKQSLRLVVESATPVLTAPDELLRVTVSVENSGHQAVTGSLNLRVAPDPFAPRDELNEWPQRGLDQVRQDGWRVKELARQRLEPGQRRTFTLEASAAGVGGMNLGLRGDEPGWGPRGILVDFETAQAGSVAAARTFVIYAPPEATTGRVKLAVVAGRTAGAGEAREAALERLARVAAATADPSITWLLDPSLLTAADNQDTASRDKLVELASAAVEAGKAVYALPYQDLDQVMLAGAGPAAAAAVSAARDLSRRYLTEALGELTAAKIRDDLAWAARPVSQTEAVGIGQAGTAALLLDAGQFEATPSGAVSRVDGGPLVAASDQRLTDALLNPPTGLGVNQVLADLAFAAQRSQLTEQPASLLVTLPRGWEPGAAATLGLLNTLVSAPWVEQTALASLLNEPGGASPALTGAANSPGPPQSDLDTLLERIGHDTAFASLTEQPGDYLARTLPPLLVPLSNTVREGAARTAAARTAVTDAATALRPVQVVAGSDVNLISEDGMVPVVVKNQSNEAVHGLVVKLTAQTQAIRIPGDARLDLSPGQSVTARVPVHALANGVFEVRVELLDQAGAPITAPTSMTMRVRAEWENVGTVIVGGLLALVLVFGLISTIRKRRAAKRRAAAAAAGDGPAAAGADGGRTAPGMGQKPAPTRAGRRRRRAAGDGAGWEAAAGADGGRTASGIGNKATETDAGERPAAGADGGGKRG
ncbi:MAG: DUF6049 family protein [Bifidobacteriaceae bacterium]|jgi:hypothetical protein|nr:DUF6049 family protein [Bifidobacteriaceae bacterium]